MQQQIALAAAVGHIEMCAHRGAGQGATGNTIQRWSNAAMCGEGRAIQRVASTDNVVTKQVTGKSLKQTLSMMMLTQQISGQLLFLR